jgi:hypothetical protein
LCVCDEPAAPVVRQAMGAALKEAGVGCDGSWVLAADNDGLVVEEGGAPGGRPGMAETRSCR